MFNHSFKSKYKKCFIVCILVMAMLLTASMPINAMGENEQPESNTEKITEVQAETADDMEAAETVSADNDALQSQEDFSKESQKQQENIGQALGDALEGSESESRAEKVIDENSANEDAEELVKEFSTDENQEMATNSLRSYTSITGTLPDSMTGLDKLYYGSVANDQTAPFHNAEELQNILENGDETYAQSVWKKYKYDLFDANYQRRGGCGALVTPSGKSYNKADANDRPDYADELLESTHHEYPKDGNGPFHNSVSAKIEPVENGTLVNGALVESDENAFVNLQKSVSPDIGDANQNRAYAIDLKATPELKQVKPTVFLFQIQTSWQMFDLMHANDRASLVNGKEVTQDLLSLYEMKQGFMDFMEWMKDYTDGSLMLGITNFQHGGTNSMIGSPYFVNDTEGIMEGLYGWDSFGDCEHIHYSNGALANAEKELNRSSNFTNWVDKNGNSIYENAEMISIIVGGACEANDLKENSAKLPTVPNGVLKHQYGIRTNSGTGVIANDMISWMDYSAQGGKKTNGAFDTGEYYKNVVTREQFFETLKSIYADVQAKAPNEQKVTNVKMEDTVTAEFDVSKSSIRAYVDGQDVTSKVIIQVTKQNDGTTKVSCEFGTVANNKEVHLQIPVQAKDDYIGSNNVFTNQGTPTVSYAGRIDDTTYTQNFTDIPAVNVPIRFEVTDGQTISTEPGKDVDLAELGKASSEKNSMTKAVEDALNKYEQTEGTLTYQWVDEDGNSIGTPTSAAINGESRTPPEIPAYTVKTTEEDIGKTYTYKLRVIFTPAEVRQETTSKVAVSARTEEGTVGIDISKKKEGKVYIRKEIDNYQNKLEDDGFIINVTSTGNETSKINTTVVLKNDEVSEAIVIKEKTVLNIAEVVPKEYEVSQITVTGGQIDGSQVTVDRGDQVVITVHNKYSGKPFFHASDNVKNIFKRK